MKVKLNQPKLGLYVHWPYCARICPYCDFNVRRDRGQDNDFLVDAIIADIRGWRKRIDPVPTLSSLSLGGGTPSLLHPRQMHRIIQAAEKNFGFLPDIEISLEANPTDFEAVKYADFAAAGVNRLSLGIQSLDNQQLEFLGRDHTVAEALLALEKARKQFTSVSADFIYGLPQQAVVKWQEQLKEILALGLQHLSLYCLSIEPKTMFFKQYERGQLVPTDDDKVADLYELTQNMTAKIGYTAYETSNHTMGDENRSKHNLLYWQGDDWIGVGPGAHARACIDGSRHELASYRQVQNYADAVQKNGWGVELCEKLSPADDLAERLLLGLRLADGIDLSKMQVRAGHEIDQKRLKNSTKTGLVSIQKGKLKASIPLLVDRIGAELLL
ncbi:MAG: radical SAM family heme chaperone HemW [Robiginitomaculum sp.]|nr:radical SAM family heme chaperone HemW [Robiginitomaculum sp.]